MYTQKNKVQVKEIYLAHYSYAWMLDICANVSLSYHMFDQCSDIVMIEFACRVEPTQIGEVMLIHSTFMHKSICSGNNICLVKEMNQREIKE